MPRTTRRKSESGFYHAVSKGDGGQIIFESDADRRRYLAELEAAAKDHGISVHAYCLMSNHVHLLVEDRDDHLSSFMKQVCERYAAYYRRSTGRAGHVFQGRFWSEPVESDRYFLAAMRYIHANPEPAGVCRAKDYPWSSYTSYVAEPTFVTTGLALDMLGGLAEFERFHDNSDTYALPFPKSSLTRHLSYDELARIAVSLLGRDTLNSLKQAKPEERLSSLFLLVEHGFTETQIARLTGIGQASIYRAVRKKS